MACLCTEMSSHSTEPTNVLLCQDMCLDGLLTALHIRFDHPTPNQLRSIFVRHFYTLDMDKAISIISTNCHHCTSLKSLPKHLEPQTTKPLPESIGMSFAADVMRRSKQYILVLHESVTSFTRAKMVQNERHDELCDTLLILCADFKSANSGIHIRVDAAPAFQSLVNDSILLQHGIGLEIGHVKNINKNCR